MSETKKNSPDSSVEFQHEAIGDPRDYEPTYGNPTVTAATAYEREKAPRFGAKEGIHETQKEVGGQSYPGRALPKSETVTEAKVEKGVAVKCAQKQTGINRYPINQSDEKKHLHGPNN
jgi:hypothetical protein